MGGLTMPKSRAAGIPRPVYVGGMLYKSIFEASATSGLSTVWMLQRLNRSKGAPVFIRGTAVVERTWVQQIVAVINNDRTRVKP